MLAKLLLTTSALALIFATPMADYNHTHIFNPRFHTGQTITLSIILGAATLFLTFRPDLSFSPSSPSSFPSLLPPPSAPPLPQPPPSATHHPGTSSSSSSSSYECQIIKGESLKLAAFTRSIYWLAGLAAWFYPGAEGQDPEFGGGGGGKGFPQGWVFGFLGLCALAGGYLGGKEESVKLQGK